MNKYVLILFALAFSGVVNAASHADEGVALVTWGEHAITVEEGVAGLQKIPPEVVGNETAIQKALTHSLEKTLVNRTLAQEARKLGLDQDGQVKAKMKLAIEQVLAEARLELIEQESSMVNFELAAQEQYKLSTNRFSQPEKVSVSHILISHKKRTAEEARRVAEEVRDMALKGQDFAELAEKYSDDGSAKRNKGNLGFFPREKMVKPFSEAAFALKNVNDISDLVETEFGFHVLKLQGRLPARVVPYEEAKVMLIEEVKKRYDADRQLEIINGIRNDPSIKINEQALQGLVKTLAKPVVEDTPPAKK